MKILIAFYKSLYDFRWLKAQRKNGELAWSYFLLFVFVAAILTIIPFVLMLPGDLKESKGEWLKKVPEFTATFSEGKLALTGLKQPFIYTDDQEQFVVVVDTVTTTSLNLDGYLDDRDYSGILVTADRAEFFDAQRQKSEIQYWTDIPDATIDRARVVSWADKLLSTPVVVLIGLFAVLALFIGIGISKLFTLLLVAFVVWIVCSFTKRQWKFGELFAVGLFGVTLSSIVALIINFAGVRRPGIYFLALLAFMLAVVFTKDETTESQAPTVSAPPSHG